MNGSSYFVLSLLIAVLLLLGYRSILKQAYADHLKVNSKFMSGVLLIGTFLFYTFLISQTELIRDLTLPPKFVLLLIVPAFLLIGIIAVSLNKKGMLAFLPIGKATLFHTMRIIIESLFIWSVGLGILHPEVTMEGYNYDLIFGVSAIIVGFLVFSKKISKGGLLLWNYLGLAMIAIIIFLFATTIYFPGMYESRDIRINTELFTFPYTLVAGFLMPSAVFMHILSIIKLKRYGLLE